MTDHDFARSLSTKYHLDRKSANKYAAIIDEARITDRDALDLETMGNGTLPSLGYKEGFVVNNMDFASYGLGNQLAAWVFHSGGMDVINSAWHSKSFGRFVLDSPLKDQGRFSWDQIVSCQLVADPPKGPEPGLGSDGYATLEMTIASFEERPVLMTYTYDDLARAESECTLCNDLVQRNRPDA